MFYYGDEFAVAVAVVAAVVYFEYIDFAVFAARAAYALFVDCFPTVLEFVVVVVAAVAVALDVVVVVVLSWFGHFFLLIKNQTLLIEFS